VCPVNRLGWTLFGMLICLSSAIDPGDNSTVYTTVLAVWYGAVTDFARCMTTNMQYYTYRVIVSAHLLLIPPVLFALKVVTPFAWMTEFVLSPLFLTVGLGVVAMIGESAVP